MSLVSTADDLIRAALFAAIAVSPFSPGLTEEELATLVVGTDGVGRGSFREALDAFMRGRRDDTGRVQLASGQLTAPMTDAVRLDENLRPTQALDALQAAFLSFQNEYGKDAFISLSELKARCIQSDPAQIEHALGLVCAWERLSARTAPFADSEIGPLHRGEADPAYTPTDGEACRRAFASRSRANPQQRDGSRCPS